MINSLDEMIAYYMNGPAFTDDVLYTAAQTGFSTHLIEKDYLCSVVLKYLTTLDKNPLLFKGGTLLSKSFCSFNRLSEDLDFSISIEPNSSRHMKSVKIHPIKEAINHINQTIPFFTILMPLTGHNQCSQYNATLQYRSHLSSIKQKILVDIGLHELVLQPPEQVAIKTLLLDPFTQAPIVPHFNILSLTKNEAYSEKIRASVCRPTLAIRDFYDIDHASQHRIIDFNHSEFIHMAEHKIANTTYFHDLKSPDVQQWLLNRVPAELAPTLRLSDADTFELSRSIHTILNILVKTSQHHTTLAD